MSGCGPEGNVRGLSGPAIARALADRPTLTCSLLTPILLGQVTRDHLGDVLGLRGQTGGLKMHVTGLFVR